MFSCTDCTLQISIFSTSTQCLDEPLRKRKRNREPVKNSKKLECIQYQEAEENAGKSNTVIAAHFNIARGTMGDILKMDKKRLLQSDPNAYTLKKQKAGEESI